MQNDKKIIPLGVKVESLKNIYDELRSNFSRLKDEENKYNRFLLKQTPPKQQKISDEIEKLVLKFDNFTGDRAKNLSEIEKQISLISRKVALKEKHVDQLRGEIVSRYEKVYKNKAENFFSSYHNKPNPDYLEEYNQISKLYNEINEERFHNGFKNSHFNIDKILTNIDQINAFEQKIHNSEHSDLSDSDRFTQLTLKPSSPFVDNAPRSAVVTIGSGSNQSFALVRSSPSIGSLGMMGSAGATFLVIYFMRLFFNKRNKEKEPEIKPETLIKNRHIEQKLSSILDENIIFNKQELTIKFNNFSPDLCQKMAIFFRNEGLGDNVSYEVNKGLTLKKLNQLNADKGDEVLDKFLAKFRNDLIEEKLKITQQKQAEEDSRKQQEDIKELQVFVNNAIAEVVNIKKSEGGKSRSSKPIERKEQKEQKNISEKVRAMENYAKYVKNFESILSQEQIDFFDKKFKEFKDLTSNKILFEAVRVAVGQTPQDQQNQSFGQVERVQTQEFSQNQQFNAPAPAPALTQNLSMPDLGKLKALFLEEGYTKIYYPAEHIESVKFEELRLGFLHHEDLEGASFKSEYSSLDDIKSSRESVGINPNDENLAKHYFHNLLEIAVDDIYQRNANEATSQDEAKKSIKDNLYSFLNYAMGDLNSVLKDYEKREIDGKSRGIATGLGHASGAKLEDSEKLCLCLKMFKDGGKLSEVKSQQLREFVKFEIFVPKFKTENSLYASEEIPIQEKSDDIFAQNLISELSNQSKKLAGQERLENVVKEFFSSNAEKILKKLEEEGVDYSQEGVDYSQEGIDYPQKISQVFATTECDGNILQYLAKNQELVKDIVDFADGEDLSVPPKAGTNIVIKSDTKSSLKDELKSVCERLKLEIGEIESSRGRAL